MVRNSQQGCGCVFTSLQLIINNNIYNPSGYISADKVTVGGKIKWKVAVSLFSVMKQQEGRDRNRK